MITDDFVFSIGITSVSIWRYFRMKLCLFDENCGEDTKSSRIDRKSDVTWKPETGIPHDLQRIHRHHGIFDNRDHALYADAVVDGTGYRNIICKTTGCS